MPAPTLRPFQQQLCADIDHAWTHGAINVMPVAATGSGKTVVLSHLMQAEAGHSLAIAHRQELVSQISSALARNGVSHRLLSSGRGNSSALLRIITALHTYELGQSFISERARAGVVGVDTLIRCKADDPWFDRVRLMVQDECFPPSTSIDGRRIADIKVGDVVRAFNDKSQGLDLHRVVRTFRNPAPKYMMRLQTVAHHVIICTPSHPIYTKRGWVLAANLTTDDEVLCDGNMLHVRGDSSRSETLRTDGAGLLREGLFWGIPRKGEQRDDGANQSQARQRQDEVKQPDGETRSSREDDEEPESFWPQAERARREWQACDSGRADADCTLRPAGIQRPVQCADATSAPHIQCAPSLQGGLRKPCAEAGNRSGRKQPSVTNRSGSGRSQDCMLEWTRVDALEVLESADIARDGVCDWDGFVYNFEVEGLHTYLAEGVVVHNCHHVIKTNKWGKAAEMFPKARGLLPTATPCRADGKGLGRHAHGIVDAMVLAPSMRQIIDMGYLTDYRIFCPTSSKLHRAALHVGSGGDFQQAEMVSEVKKAQIVGDVVAAYLKHGNGKRGVTFCVDVEEAETQAAAFRAAGVPAAALSALSPDNERARVLQQLRSGELLQVTNVDLFGEGFDLPAIEIVQFARPTQSFGLYVQQFGRVLRLMLTPEELRGYNDLSDEGRRAVIALSGKPYGTIIDHVGNVEAHGLPDKPRMWSLDAREARSSTPGLDDIPLRICLTCTQPFERVYKVCPWCGAGIPEPESRSRIECVDGDLIELSVEALAALRGEIARIDGEARVPYGLPQHAVTAVHRRHAERQEAQRDLRSAIAWWAGYQSARGASESESYRRFYLRYGVDVGTAQTLGRPEAAALAERVHADMQAVGVDSSQCAITWAQKRAGE